MKIRPVFTWAEFRGLSRLGFSAAVGVTYVAEELHEAIQRTPLSILSPGRGRTRGLAGFVYRCVRGGMRAADVGVDFALGLAGGSQQLPPSRGRVIALAVINGGVGDRLAETGNSLALSMEFRIAGHTLRLDRTSLATAIPDATGRLVVLVHGLCMSDLQWTRKEHDHGAALARDCGVTPVFLSYNSGLHISQNGRAFADMLERLVAQWPTQVEEIVLLGHSMGGLVARSAVHYANLSGHGWTRKLSKMVFLGAPHHGAPLERIGSWVEGALGKIPYAAVFGRLGAVRSAGITDLRYGFLVDEDWRAADRCAHGDKARAVIPLPDRVACYAIAATTAKTTGGIWDQTIGDGLVQVASALGAHRDPALSLRFPREHTAILCETGHLDLLASQEAYATIRNWLEPA